MSYQTYYSHPNTYMYNGVDMIFERGDQKEKSDMAKWQGKIGKSPEPLKTF